jgi:hypothetical protein
MPDEPSDRLIFFDGADQRLQEWEVNRSAGLALIEHMFEQGRIPGFPLVEQLLARGLEIAPDDTPVMTSLTEVALKSGNLTAAEKYATQILAHNPQSESGLTAMVHLCYQSNRAVEGLAYADRLVKINPMNATLHAQRADMLRMAGRLAEGIPLRRWLSNAYRDMDQMEKSEEQLSIIRRIELAPPAK